jgi:very-short-patch-repair endonuclease
MSIYEARPWSAIRGKATGPDFVDRSPSDFGSLEPKLVIEVDDLSHEFRDETRRTRYFEAAEFAVLRLTNEQIAKELPAAVSTVEAWVEYLRRRGQAPE